MPENDQAPSGAAPTGVRERLRSVPAHPTLVVIAGACLLVIAIVALLQRPASIAQGEPQAWGGTQAIALDPTEYANTPASTSVSNASSLSNTTAQPTYIAPTTPSGGASTASTDDLAAILAELSTPVSVSASTTASSGGVAEAYSYIPQGLISTTSLSGPKRTDLQQQLYDYGNDAGGYIQSYDNSHRAVVQTLTDEIADRYNDEKDQAVRDVGDALIAVGTHLESIDPVPSVAASDNAALAKSYEDIGAKLKAVPDAKTDQQLLSAVEAYDTAADSFTKRYVALAQLFSGAGVQFGSADPGSVFTFTNSQGL